MTADSPKTNSPRPCRAELIRRWQPWLKSTGPRTMEGKARSARNADKGKGYSAAARQEQVWLTELRRLLRP